MQVKESLLVDRMTISDAMLVISDGAVLGGCAFPGMFDTPFSTY